MDTASDHPEFSRKEHLREFSQETTFHGLRFIAHKHYHPFRRFLWVLIVLCCIGTFVFVITQRAVYLHSYPKAVNLDVVYARELEVPAVTICNQNFFRRSETFKMGIYDDIEERFGQEEDQENYADLDSNCKEGFIEERGKYFETVVIFRRAKFGSVSLSVCQRLCTTTFTMNCNSVVYNKAKRTCFIMSLPDAGTQPLMRDGVSTYRRSRCNGENLNICHFDDNEEQCPLRSTADLEDGLDGILRTSGPSDIGVRKDHTTGTGKYLVTEGYNIVSPYIEAREDVCLEFALFGNASTLLVFQKFADLGSSNLFEITSTKAGVWERQFIYLTPGIFKLEFTFSTPTAMDDISYGPCKYFVRECKLDEVGKSYIGSHNMSSSGNYCISWNEAYSRLNMSLTAKELAAGSSCRNFNSDTQGPGCYISDLTYEYCNIPYCACQADEFQCRTGLCIKKPLTCDLYKDCPDGEDELEGCDISITCEFEQVYSCGYTNVTSEFIHANAWRRYIGQMRNGHTANDKRLQLGGLHYLYLDSSSVSMYRYQRVSVISPIHNITWNQSLAHCLTLRTYTVRDFLFADAMGTIRIYQSFGKYDQRQLMEIEGTDAETNKWMERQINIPATFRPFRILIEAVFGESFYSDMGVDSIKISERDCASQVDRLPLPGCSEKEFSCWNDERCIPKDQVCDGHRDCPDEADEDPVTCSHLISIGCDFNQPFLCGYTDESNPIVHGWQPSVKNSSIILVGQSFEPVFLKRLVSRFVPLEYAQCLSIHHKMTVKRANCLVSIYRELSDSRHLHLSLLVTQDRSMRTLTSYFTIPADTNKGRLSIETKCNQDAQDLLLEISEIGAENVSCEEKFETGLAVCDFRTPETCRYLDMSGGPGHWWRSKEGFVAENNNEEEIQVQLLTPLIYTNISSCIVFKFSLSGEGSAGIKVDDYINELQLVWGQWFRTRSTVMEIEVPVLTFVGVQRFVLGAVLFGNVKVVLLQSEVRDHAECSRALCPMSGHHYQCNDGHCVSGLYRCDMKFDCWVGEDESGCERLSPAGPEYDIIYDDDDEYDDNRKVPNEEIQDPNMAYVYRTAGHQLEDLIYSCTFAGRKCKTENFTSEITDYGYCHTLNTFHEDPAALRSRNTGASSGLRLILNIEQYEYMSGPHTDAGVKVFLYNQEEVPFVRDLGFAVGPGEHALVGMTLTQSSSLNQPWGNCGVKPLKYGGSYTYSACIRECETESMCHACGCKDAYMPGLTESSICNMSDYLHCVSLQSELISESMENCRCIEPCSRQIYETQLSYASLSGLSVAQILTTDLDLLKEKNKAALDIRKRTLPDIFVNELGQIARMAKAYERLLSTLRFEAWTKQTSVFQKIEKALCTLVTDVLQKDIDKTVIKYYSDFLKAFDAAYGRVRQTIRWHLQALPVEFDLLLRALDSDSSTKNPLNLTKSLHRISQLITVLEESISIYYNSSWSSKSVFNSTNLILDEHILIKLPLNLSPGNDSCAVMVQNLLHNSIPNSMDMLNHLSNTNSPMDINIRDLYDVFLALETDMKNVEHCLNNYVNHLQDIKEENQHVTSMIRQMMSSLTLCPESATIDDILDYIDETSDIRDMSVRLSNILEKIYGEPTNDVIARTFNEDAITEARVDLENLVSRIESRLIERSRMRIAEVRKDVINIYLKMIDSELQMSRYLDDRYNPDNVYGMDIWRRPQPSFEQDKTLIYATDTFRFVLTDQFIHQAFKVMSELIGWYMRPLQAMVNDFEVDIRSQKTRIKEQLDTAKNQFKAYKEQLVLGENFVRENFLAIDIYFAQLKYQHIQQIKAYDVESFFSDIGGFMGLLLGGSIITLFEFLDLIFFKLMPCFNAGKVKKKRNKMGTAV